MMINQFSPAASGSLPGEKDIRRVQTANGITILARASFTSPAVALQGYLPAGSILDPQEKLGLANFTAAALLRGTVCQTFQEIYDALESVGASLGFSSGMLTTTFGGQALVEDLGVLLRLLRQALEQPVFPGEQIERLRAQYLTALAIRAEDTAAMAALTFDANLYENHPFSRPEDGYPETIAAVAREDLVDFHARHYGPQGMVITVVGAIDPQAAIDSISECFQDWQNPNQENPPEVPALIQLPPAKRIHVPIPGKSQSDVILGCVGPERRSPDFYAASLGNLVLGQLGMYGRLGEHIREKEGLAYYAYSNLNAGSGPGAWFACAGVDPMNVDRVIDLLLFELRRFTSEPVSDEELSDAKANTIGQIPLAMESNAGVCMAITQIERYGLGLDYLHRLEDLVNSITKEEILAAAQKYLKFDHLVIVSAGPET